MDPPVSEHLPFAAVTDDLHAAARLGPGAVLHDPLACRVRRDEARRVLLGSLLPHAASGLTAWGVSSEDTDYYLGVVERRVATGRTGAFWQMATVATLENRGSLREAAVREMVRRYLAHSRTGEPVHTWPV
jgi:hypothetical protein